MGVIDPGIAAPADGFGLFPGTAVAGPAAAALRRAGGTARDVRVHTSAGGDRPSAEVRVAEANLARRGRRADHRVARCDSCHTRDQA